MAPGTLEQTARWVGRARWVEQRCFELLGGWVLSTPEPDVKLLFARQSHHHAWHAELFERVLPAANGFPAGPATPATGDAWSAFLTELAETTATADRLVGAYDLLMAHKLVEYERWHGAADRIRDAPLVRWLGFIITDERADLDEGRGLLVDRRDAASRRSALTASLERAGALLG